jgi:chemotaxis protein histidine kinase CheA
MDQLREQVSRARRRLVLEQFMGRLVWCLFATLSLAALGIAAPRLFVFHDLPTSWDAAWLLGGFGAGILAAVAWTLISNRSPLDAAMEIDHRFDLRERVASSLSLSDEDRASGAGQAVVNDALRAVRRIEVDEKFRVQLDRRAWWPLVPAAIVFVLVAFVDNREAASEHEHETIAQVTKQVKQSAESLRKKMEEKRKEAEKQGLEAAQGIFKQIEQGTKELQEKKDLDRTKAAVKLNDLQKQLEQRRQQLGGEDKIKQQFESMKNLGAGPAEKAAQAMKEGDWKKALDKEQLAKQLEQMKDKLQAAVDAHKQAMQDLEKQVEKQKQQGNMAKAGELQKKLDALKQQQAQMNRLQQLAQQMAQAQQALQQGDGQKSANAMAQMAQQLDQMQKDMEEMKMLDAAMNQLDMAKDAMACQNCDGKGCEQCQGQLGMNGMNGLKANLNGEPGMGMGQGVGIGPRPEEKNATKTRDTQVRQNPGRGAATFSGLVEGPNIKGDVAESIKEEMATLSAEPADPLTSERLPSSRREHAGEYFDMLREGK